MMWMRFRSVLPCVLIGLVVIATFGMVMVPIAGAAMVVAPSKIIINSNVNAENYKLKNDNDNTIKAIIGYPLEEGEVVVEDPSDLAMTIFGKNKVISIDASSLRYCYVDYNLIIEFDREMVVDALIDGEVQGPVDVEVAGSFEVVGEEDGETTVRSGSVDEMATILVSNPQATK